MALPLHVYYQNLFQIRPATVDDIPDIMKITREAFTKYKELAGIEHVDALDETYDDVKRDIENDKKIVLLALSDGEPVGSARVEVYSDGTAELTRFGVKVTSQNNGIGKSIMNLVDRLMIKRQVKSLRLYTGAKITPLIRFYYGRGFYIDSTDKSRGYIRAKLVKDYK